MNIDVFNTHIEVYPYVKDDIPILEDFYTATDKYSGNEFPCGYMIDNGKLILPRGTPISKLESLCNVKARFIVESDPSDKMSSKHYPLYDPRNKLQEDSIKFLKGKEHQLALNLKTGYGKGEPYSRKIPTPTEQGWTLMGDLKIGDEVFSKDGSITQVENIFELGNEIIYKISFEDGRHALCTSEHLWQVKTSYEDEYKIIDTIHMFNDFKRNRSEFYIPVNDPVQYIHRETPINPYVMGVLIGNGHLDKIALTIYSVTDSIPEKVANLCGFTYKLLSKKKRYYVFYDVNGVLVTTDSFLKDHPELIGLYNYNKTIPDVYMYNSYFSRMQFINGLMDSNGFIDDCQYSYEISFLSRSEELLKQIQQMMYMNGLFAHIEKIDNHYEYHGKIIFDIPNDMKAELFSIESKVELASNARHIEQGKCFSHMKISNIELINIQQSRCIKVKHDSALYLTEDYIVTHNTFCVAYAVNDLSIKTLVITPNESLKQQWINTFVKMFDYRPKHLMNIAGSNVIDAIMDDMVEEADIYFVNHQTLRSYMTQYGGYKFHQFLKKLKIGIKVYDESHMEFANILLIDNYSNTDRTWYLTATFDRSDKTESVCFKRAFMSVIEFGAEESAKLSRKHVIYHMVNINSMISPKDRARLMGFPGFTAAKYGQYAFFGDKNNTAYNAILTILKNTKNMEGKTLIFVPLIESADELVKRIRKDFPEKSVAAYHSKVSREDKESAEKKDIIVSTIKSAGTGRDIPGLRSVICAEPVASKVVIEQTIGRLREYAPDKDTYYWDIVDRSIPPLTWWFKGRFKKIESLVKKVINLEM